MDDMNGVTKTHVPFVQVSFHEHVKLHTPQKIPVLKAILINRLRTG
jgi:hypothetical protein